MKQSDIYKSLIFPSVLPYGPIGESNDEPYTITYKFAGNEEPDDAWYDYSGWESFSSSEKSKIRDALDSFEKYLNVKFVEVSGGQEALLDLGQVQLGNGIAGQGGPSIQTEFISGEWVLSEYKGVAVFANDYELNKHVIVHEIGHALGLKHSFEGDYTLPDEYENGGYTVMSYTPDPFTGEGQNELMLFDIVALQHLWGSNDDRRSGDTTYSNFKINDTKVVWDGGGTDTFDFRSEGSSASEGGKIDLREGKFSILKSSYDGMSGKEKVGIAYGTEIENAFAGDKSTKIIGNTLDNYLKGGDGDDEVYGKSGDDKIRGGGGDDFISGDSGRDKLYGGSRDDLLKGMSGKDRLYGESGDDNLKGGSSDDVLKGGSGNDKLHGGSGVDILSGQAGEDTFIFKPGDDKDFITDFSDADDRLDLRKFEIESVKEAKSLAKTVGSDTVFDFGNGDVLTLEDFSKSSLDSGDFLL